MFCSFICRRYSSNLVNTNAQSNILKRKLDFIVAYYEECLGITELQKARNEVTQVSFLLNFYTCIFFYMYFLIL